MCPQLLSYRDVPLLPPPSSQCTRDRNPSEDGPNIRSQNAQATPRSMRRLGIQKTRDRCLTRASRENIQAAVSLPVRRIPSPTSTTLPLSRSTLLLLVPALCHILARCTRHTRLLMFVRGMEYRRTPTRVHVHSEWVLLFSHSKAVGLRLLHASQSVDLSSCVSPP